MTNEPENNSPLTDHVPPPATTTTTTMATIEKCLLSNDIYDYHIVSQGKTTVPSMDDGEEMTITDVRTHYTLSLALPQNLTTTDNSQRDWLLDF